MTVLNPCIWQNQWVKTAKKVGPSSTLHKHFSRPQYLLFDFYHTPNEKILGSLQLRLTLMTLRLKKE